MPSFLLIRHESVPFGIFNVLTSAPASVLMTQLSYNRCAHEQKRWPSLID